MRTKYLISAAAVTTAALALSACGAALPEDVKGDKLNDNQKEVIATWYDAVPEAEQARIKKMSADDVLAAANGFFLLCGTDEEQRGKDLAKAPYNLDKIDAIQLADVIEDNLCEGAERSKPTGKPSPSKTPKDRAITPESDATAPVGRSAHRPAVVQKKDPAAQGAQNTNHDLGKAASRHDREEATLKAPANREPAWTHTDLGIGKGHVPSHDDEVDAKNPAHKVPTPKAAPAAKAPARH